MNGDRKHIEEKIKRFSEQPGYQAVQNRSLSLDVDKVSYQITRLNDEQYRLLRKNSLTIAEDHDLFMALYCSKQTIYRSFSRMYATLKSLFGESGHHYDDWKSSFSFPFLVYFEKEGHEVDYLLNVYNFRSSIEMILYKLIRFDNQDDDRMIIHQPFSDFPQSDIKAFTLYFLGYLTGYFKAYVETNHTEFFYKSAESNLIIFGYENGAFFDLQFDDPEAFEAKQAALKRAKPAEPGNSQR